jgi:alkanesulfonate monooxygenase SsuD/methylene tetrahydromethanopterin reductase-like flavin-dependent oxidoreductase (luciferase family)
MARNDSPLHLGVTLGGVGSHPRAWRLVPDQARAAFGAAYHQRLAAQAEQAALDFLYFDDAYALQSDDDRDFRGRLDAALLAARLAPVTRNIGLVPAFTVTHAEPFHISKAVATVDHASLGRAGWALRTAGADDPVADQQNDHFGRRPLFTTEQAWAEAGEVADVVQRLFDSWEDDAEIRDLSTGRFVDRDKLHYVDFQGEFFSVKGPSITPRPPQGRPLTVIPVRTTAAAPVAGRYADVAIVSAADHDAVAALADQVRDAAAAAGRQPELTMLTELDVLLAPTASQVSDLRSALDDDLRDRPRPQGTAVDATPAELAGLLADLAPGIDGALINFAVLPAGLELFTAEVVPELVDRGLFRAGYGESTLRQRFGLPRAANIYAA